MIKNHSHLNVGVVGSCYPTVDPFHSQCCIPRHSYYCDYFALPFFLGYYATTHPICLEMLQYVNPYLPLFGKDTKGHFWNSEKGHMEERPDTPQCKGRQVSPTCDLFGNYPLNLSRHGYPLRGKGGRCNSFVRLISVFVVGTCNEKRRKLSY